MRTTITALALAALFCGSTALAQTGEGYEDEAVGGPDYEEQAVGHEGALDDRAADHAALGHEEAVEAHDTAAHDVGAAEAGGHGEHGEEGHEPGAHGGHGEGHHDTSINWVEMSGSLVNFGIWLALLVVLLRKPLAEFLRNRRASVVEGMDEAKRVKEEAEAKYKEYSERIENLDAELERLREEMRRAGQDERERIVREAEAKGERMRAEARFLIEQQMKQLRQDLTREAIEAAVRTAEELLTKQTTAADQERLANEYLATLKSSLKQKIEEKRL